MKALQPPDDCRSKRPDHQHGIEIVPPLDAESSDGFGCKKEYDADREVRRIPDVPVLHADQVLRRDGDDSTERIGPEGRRSQQNTDADPADVGARKVRPLTDEEFSQNKFGKDAAHDCKQRFFIAFKNSEREMSHQQDQGDEDGRNKSILHAEGLAPASSRSRRDPNLPAHCGSLMELT